VSLVDVSLTHVQIIHTIAPVIFTSKCRSISGLYNSLFKFNGSIKPAYCSTFAGEDYWWVQSCVLAYTVTIYLVAEMTLLW